MKELITDKDIFYLPMTQDAVCITTNGIVKKDGNAVMGAGIAKQANDMFHVSSKLGGYINTYGNRAFNLGTIKRGEEIFYLFTYPTKYHFKDNSDINLIVKSAEQLMEMADKFNVKNIYLPPVGCGLGNLNYEVTVKPWISNILDDRFIVVLRR